MNAPEVLAHYHAIPTLIEEVKLRGGSFTAWDRARSLTLDYQGWRLISPEQSAQMERDQRALMEALQDLINNPFRDGTRADLDLKNRAINVMDRIKERRNGKEAHR